MSLSPELAMGMEWSAVALNIAFTILIGLEKRIGWLLHVYEMDLHYERPLQ